MKAKAIKEFTASVSGRDFKCAAGDEIEADAKTVGQLEAIGLVEKAKPKRATRSRKAEEND